MLRANPFTLADYTRKSTTFNIDTKQYEIRAWLFYRVAPFTVAGYPKVHISLEQTPENLKKAQAVVEKILVKYQLVEVKITTEASLKAFRECYQIRNNVDISNVSGKEITLFMLTRVQADNCNPEFWKELFRDFEAQLKEAGVKPNPKYKSTGDGPLPGSNWISYRDQDNIFGMYVSAKRLVMAGFTRHESANLTGRFKKFFSIPDAKQPLNPIKLSINITPDFSKTNYTEILTVYKNQIAKAREVFFPNEISDDKYALPFQAMFYPTAETVQHLNQAANTCLDVCLTTAARHTAIIHASLKKTGFEKKLLVVNSIIPAIYHHFVKPLVEKARARNGKLLVSDIDTKKLIREIIKCGLRAQGSHIHVDQPRYIFDLTENVFDELLDKIDRHEAALVASASAAFKQKPHTAPAAPAAKPKPAILVTTVHVRTAAPAIPFHTIRYGFYAALQSHSKIAVNTSQLAHPQQGAGPSIASKR